MVNDADGDRLQALGMLASALAGRPVAVAPLDPGDPSWTDGQTVFVDPSARPRENLESVAVHASLIAADSLAPEVVGALVRHPRLAKRYLTVEGHRALAANGDVLPGVLNSMADRETASRTDSPESSLSIASGRDALDDPPIAFGVIRAKKIIAAGSRAAEQVDHETAAHVPRRESREALEELDDGEVDDTDDPDLFSSPVGGGGFIGKWMKKMLSSARKSGGSGGGPPGADLPTHRTNSANRGAFAVSSTATASVEDVADIKAKGFKYPEWDANRKSYRPDWCTVREVEPRIKASAPQAIDGAIGLRRPLARLGMGLHRRHRQSQGDDIDIDAAVEARVEVRAGSVPDEAVYLDSLRRRRDLSVLLLLDVSGSTAEPGTVGRTVHQQQRAVISRPHGRAARPGRSGGAVRLLLTGAGRGEHGARQAVRRPSRRRGDPTVEQPRAGSVFATGRGHPPRFGCPGGARRHIAAPAGRGVGRAGLRPRLRACLRCRRCTTRVDGSSPPGDRLCVPDSGSRHRRRSAEEGVRKHCTRDHRPARATGRHRRPAFSVGYPLRRGTAPRVVTSLVRQHSKPFLARR